MGVFTGGHREDKQEHKQAGREMVDPFRVAFGQGCAEVPIMERYPFGVDQLPSDILSQNPPSYGNEVK